MRKFSLALVASVLVVALACNSVNNDVAEKPAIRPPVLSDPSPLPLSPEESIKKIHLPEGYRLELVAAEPMVQEPVAIEWDADGNLYVAEMLTYMQDVDGRGEDEPLSRIVKLEDTDGDGRMDKRTVYLDSLVLPRIMLSLDDRLIVQETYANNLFAYRDTDHDGKADEKVQVLHDDTPDKRNLEHQRSGLMWNLDNWIYTSHPIRYKWKNNQLEIDSLRDVPDGQWGLGHDDYGRLFLSSAGGEVAAKGFQQMPAYGELDFEKEQYAGDFHEPWPIIATPDVQGGKIRLRDDSTLNHFTASCGQTIFRGDRLPKGMEGDLFICEPVGRLIRRAKVLTNDGVRVVKNAYDKAEFIASTDMNFRPVNLATGPDGCMYIVDMYRGIIQEGAWVRPDSYLRPQVLRFGLDKNIRRGRIYRLVHEAIPPDAKKPSLLEDSPGQLVQYLSHPNGWWRDNAQKLLIVRNEQSVVPDLKKIVSGEISFWNKPAFRKTSPTVLGRIHALWTLEGLQAVDKDLLIKLMQDPLPELRRMAVWVSEPLIEAGDPEIFEQLTLLANDEDTDVRTQLAQSLRYSTPEKATPLLESVIGTANNHKGMIYQAAQITMGYLTTGFPVDIQTDHLNEADKALVIKGAENFKSLCSSCHGSDGKGLQFGGSAMVAPPLSGSKRVNGDPGRLIRIVLSGLTGPVDGKEYPSTMPPMLNSDDQWLAEVLSYIRTNLGNAASAVHPADIKKVRDVVGRRWDPWTLEELEQDGKR
ncbi:MAG: HEAT repeat domain-containing protein [Chitinophagaceae bacterium]|nr:HEAT repeat domain-containing protein [Chitinophagaceae bacterium]